MVQRIIPNVWCQGTAAEAGLFYASVFPQADATVVARYPESGLPDFQQRFAGRELVVDVTIRGYRIRLINASDDFAPTPALSFIIPVDPRHYDDDAAARADIDRMWAALADGGEIRMPLGAYPHSERYGWVTDRYGVNWQLMLGGGPERPAVMPQLLFTGPKAQARDAVDTYVALFPDSAVGNALPRTDLDGGVLLTEFVLAGQRFSAMDGGPEHDFTFTPGVSLEVDCTGQGEIDRLWDALSAVPEAEACGWLVDRFGVSWQIVPENMGELMQRDGAYQRMLAMKKIVIADL